MNNELYYDDKIVTFPWVIFKSGDSLFAVSCNFVESIVFMQDIVPFPVPGASEYIRGMISLRGKIYHSIDFRVLLGKKSLKEIIYDFCQMIDQRLKDHVNWLQELEGSIKDRREFKLTTDPHKCSFGKWYDSFKTKSVMLSSELRKLDEPHKKIHLIANQAKSLESEERYDEAASLIEKTRRHELSKLTGLLEGIKKLYQESKREILLILSMDNKSIGLICDEVVSVEMLVDGDETKSEMLCRDASFLEGVSTRKEGNDMVIRIDTKDLVLSITE